MTVEFLHDEARPGSNFKSTSSHPVNVSVQNTEVPSQDRDIKQIVHECPLHKTNHTSNNVARLD